VLLAIGLLLRGKKVQVIETTSKEIGWIQATGAVNDNMSSTPGKTHKDPDYAAMVNRMDHNVGRVLAKLNELALDARTIVIFTSDNGGVDFDQRGIVPTSNLANDESETAMQLKSELDCWRERVEANEPGRNK
jgi:arylsulfatase A-like enzyme